MTRLVPRFSSIAIVLALAIPAARAEPNADTSLAMWDAQWITDTSAPPLETGVYHFRKEFALVARPDRFLVKVSADNRYRLFVNGIEIVSGPARGDLMHWRYETVDIATHLQAGRNVIAALVWNMGDARPAAQVSLRTAFVLQGVGEQASVVNTNNGWKVLADKAYSFDLVEGEDTGGFYVAGPREAIDATRYPWGWERPEFNDSLWPQAGSVAQQFTSPGALPRGMHPAGSAAEWQLVPRNIPLPETKPTRFAAVRRSSGISVPKDFVAGESTLTIPPNTRAVLLLDQGQMTMGFPVLRTSGGEGASATATYAESLFDRAGNKGNRNVIDGKSIRGLRDAIRFDGGKSREFRPLWLRAWRYLQLDIQTGPNPLIIEDVHTLFTAYPFVQRASFESDAAWITPIWDMNWRALRLSAFETFWDTPYYEQLQYVGDTRIEALLSVYQSGDDRLMRNAIELFDHSRLSEGLTASSYPSHLRQQIPPFSLWWVAMVHDYWLLRDDPAFVRARLPGVRAVLDWYEAQVDDTGLVGPAPWWNFLDWTEPYERGVPPGAGDGHSTAITLQYIYALQRAAALESALGHSAEGERYADLADKTVSAVRLRAWDARRGLFADSAEGRKFSQQTNALAVLVGAVPPLEAKRVMEHVIKDGDLVQASFYFRFYIDEALREAGMAGGYLARLQPWREMVRNGMTSTAETPEPTRSDSHAWSAHPNYGLLATVLGIRPGGPGFRSVNVTPELGALKRMKGTMPHPAGAISVAFVRSVGGMRGTIELPSGIPGELRFRGSQVALSPGHNSIVCRSDCVRTGD